MWATMNEVADPGRLWLDLLSTAPSTGLVPIVLDGLSRQPERPWDSGELDPQPAPALDDLDEAVVFKQGWNKGVPLGLLPPSERPPRLRKPGMESRPEPEYEEDDEEREFFLELVALRRADWALWKRTDRLTSSTLLGGWEPQTISSQRLVRRRSR